MKHENGITHIEKHTFPQVLVHPTLRFSCVCASPSDFDSGLGMMTGIAPMNTMMPGLGYVPPPPLPQDLPIVKEIIHCQSCTLFPPNPRKSISLYLTLAATHYKSMEMIGTTKQCLFYYGQITFR